MMKSVSTSLLMTVAVILISSYGSANPFRPLPANCHELCVGSGCIQESKGTECGVLGNTMMCGRLICYKGPGDACGTPYDQLGLCAPSLLCRSNICKGCVLVNNEKNCSQWDHHFTEHFFNSRYGNGC